MMPLGWFILLVLSFLAFALDPRFSLTIRGHVIHSPLVRGVVGAAVFWIFIAVISLILSLCVAIVILILR
ncbi:hypothetical protein C5B42_04580 [Candidatus Cerribacteria bacterium 'Amazon FNV 2010 28 9']|uniref:Uncharacterized protein n=1 Tax=Candidatus Cerribacteria bacterium 'Amazon FNV 2010 28 9' TaxID=2081795 RepID=A0A317JP33_9BACT|nr:MAG: hypothetical protein C5B42_04580 [Candidatus Cerribacteria bacterium 'Amazon FNV 2010 28 9']